MLKHRLIPNIILNKGMVVQSKNFNHTNIIGNAITAVDFFNSWAVDEMLILDVSRNKPDKAKFIKIINGLSNRCFIPLSIGGWIENIDDIRNLLNAGADKVVINTKAVENPDFIKDSSKIFGSQCIVVSIDVKINSSRQYEVLIDRGRKFTSIHPVEWSKEVEKLGAGEILLTSIDREGTMNGYDLELLQQVCKSVKIPVIAFGGVGKWQDFVDGIKDGKADAVSAANIFHYTEHSTFKAKEHMYKSGLNVRKPSFYKVPYPRRPKYEDIY